MYEINEELNLELSNFNELLSKKYSGILDIDRNKIRRFIDENVGEIVSLEKQGRDFLNNYIKKGGVVGIDASVNKKGGAYPHYVELFQGLAKSTKFSDDPIIRTKLYSPLLDMDEEDQVDSDGKVDNKRNKYLSDIEVEVALESIDRYDPDLIMMDGSLLRFKIYSLELWEMLKTKCVERSIHLIGVIEDTKTKMIGEKLKEENEDINLAYDRELLFGNLDYGELVIIDDSIKAKGKGKVELNDISSGFMRSALSPNVIGLDILKSQREDMRDMASLVLTLTPENSRGIPLWLDLIDSEVKISSQMLEGLLKKHLDTKLYERLFVEIRSKRN